MSGIAAIVDTLRTPEDADPSRYWRVPDSSAP